MGRLLAICGWIAAQLTRPIDRGPLRQIGGRRIGAGFVALLLVIAAAVMAVGLAEPQPQDTTVDEVMNGGVTHPDGWIRLRGRAFPLAERPVDEPGDYGLFVDEDDPLRAIVVRPMASVVAEMPIVVTGHLAAAAVSVVEDLPIEATVFGTPPRVAADRLLELDPVAQAERTLWWPVSLGLALLAIVLAIGLRSGYPVFRASREVAVLARPLGPGNRLPAVVGGTIDGRRVPLDDPAEALLVAGRGGRGPILMLQLLSSSGPAPPPVAIGGSWSNGTVGYVHTVGETVPALTVRAEGIEAIVMFARTSERDRAAIMVGVRR